MLNLKRAAIALAITGFAAATQIPGAQAAGWAGAAVDYGTPVTTAAADRVINITADTKYVSVNNGETVQFKAGDKMFTWHFDTFPEEARFDLSKIAPAGFTAMPVRVYVASNPLYRG
ncbi:CzcE family metal-binding protein [Janthinobacterium sp. Mn2066]|uniref:CzcE family metal-binding protein n=1 Tax=Janthinobacterium sp. Mn2066 TaxID=3395264 RepID=UPI003BE05FA9